MALVQRLTNLNNLLKTFNKLSISEVQNIPSIFFCKRFCNQSRSFSVSNARPGLMEFFDDDKNWGAQEVKSGRAWKKEELRIKSNVDLHKLWYVLLKERNMLLTMEHEAKEQTRLFPSPERLDKVEESMENLEAVVRERNVAYHQLEIGETGERPGKVTYGPFGLKFYYKMCEYPLPKHMNRAWRLKHQFYKPNRDTEAFLVKYREKLYLNKRKKRARDFNHVIGLMNRFPNIDMEALKEQYPDVDIEQAKRSRRYHGHLIQK